MPIEANIADELLTHHLDLMRFEVSVRARVLRILTELQTELVVTLNRSDITAFTRIRQSQLFDDVTAVIDKYYADVAAELSAATAATASTATSHASAVINSSLQTPFSLGLPTATYLKQLASNTLIQGAASAEWWAKQAADTTFRFKNAVRQGVAAGETAEQIAIRISGSTRLGTTGVMDIARSNARSLVHTSIQAVANASRLDSFRANSDVIDHLVWLATLDGSTCPEICGPRDLKPYTLEDDPPEPMGHVLDWNDGPGAIHWGCRCIVTIGSKTFEQLGVDLPEPKIGRRASMDGTKSASMSFEDFLDRKGTKFQDEVLGPGRAQLWREKGLTLMQLLDLSGNPMTLAELTAKYG